MPVVEPITLCFRLKLVFHPRYERNNSGVDLTIAEAVSCKCRTNEQPENKHGDSLKNKLLRPWKLASFACGLSLLFYGAIAYKISDWDIGISIIMAFYTYISAPFFCKTVFAAVKGSAKIQNVLFAMFMFWFTVDGCYVLYHAAMGNETFRWENFCASSFIYLICGMIWLHEGSLKTIYQIKR